MHTEPTAHGLWEITVALVISLISASVSIARRIVNGHEASYMWLISEYLTAILCGYLMYEAYPMVSHMMPNWATLPVAVAFVAHSGGRVFQECESIILEHYGLFKRQRNKL
jgi:hypothetical protein